MRIAIFTNNYLPNPYGVSVSIESFRKHLEILGHEVFVFAPKWKDYQDNNPRIFRFPSVVTNFRFHFPLPWPRSSLIEKIFSQLRINVIHAQHPNLLGATALRLAKKHQLPIVFTWHTLYDQYTNFVPFLPSKLAAHWMISKAIKFANQTDQVIVPTESVVDKIRDWGVTKDIVAILTGIEEDRFQNARPESIRQKYDIPNEAILLLLVSRLTEEKNILFVFDSVIPILKSKGDVYFLVAGDGYLLTDLKKRAREYGLEKRIIFTGLAEREAIKNYYAAADIFVYASMSETQGMVITEALYMGLPVVAVRATGISSLIENGINGILTSPSVSDFSQAIVKLMDDPEKRKRLGEMAQKIAQKELTATICAERMIALYEKVIYRKQTFW